ncbi:hypothetical protein BSLG_001162 [Batrachochytrium salamandrivorans]|nr:hypothetical protein BSLG_001162 [Batrachochytrium salamandrivorans]
MVQRIDYEAVSVEMFARDWETPALPVVILGATSTWSAHTAWDIETFAQTYRNEKAKVGQDDHGKTVFMGIRYFLHYALVDPNGAAIDDSPLYIFDGSFGDRTE